MAYPIKTKRGDEDAAKAQKYLGKNYKDGGRVKDDSGTNIHISINAAPKPGGGPGGPPDPALAAALAQAAAPPTMPPPGMAGAPPDPSMMGGAPPMGAGAGQGPIAMRRGGRVNKPTGGETSAASKTKGDKVKMTHAPIPPPARKAKGGGAGYPQLTNESGGGYGGLGRIRKAQIAAKNHEK